MVGHGSRAAAGIVHRAHDPMPGIAWQLPVTTLSERGQRWPLLREGDATAFRCHGPAAPA